MKDLKQVNDNYQVIKLKYYKTATDKKPALSVKKSHTWDRNRDGMKEFPMMK